MTAKSEFKNFLSRLVFIALVGALIAFLYTLFLPKVWQMSGKIVVFPSGHPASASQNLSEEVGNTAWIINSDTFQERNFGEFTANLPAGKAGFSGAEVKNSSSVVLVKFRSDAENIEVIEDLIVKIPAQVDEYARDLYDGSPFKYKIVGDPEISLKPVSPDMTKNVYRGFAAGAILFFLYWLFAESFVSGRRVDEEEESFIAPAIPISPKKPLPEPQPKLEKKPEPEPEKKVEKTITPQRRVISPIGAVPSNLPIAETPSAPETSEYHEPSDEEVKERLNKLMRGEL